MWECGALYFDVFGEGRGSHSVGGLDARLEERRLVFCSVGEGSWTPPMSSPSGCIDRRSRSYSAPPLPREFGLP